MVRAGGIGMCVVAAALVVSAGNLMAGEGGTTILGPGNAWRLRVTWERDEVLLKSGKVEHARLKLKGSMRKSKTVEDFEVVKIPAVTLPPKTPTEWAKAEFDDSAWIRKALPVFGAVGRSYTRGIVYTPYWKLILARGRFKVTDPAGAGDLELSLEFKGGVVVHLNGVEVGRAHMPEGKVGPLTPAKPYMKDSFLRPDGYLVWGRKDLAKHPQVAARRLRKLTALKIPGSKLRKGINVLAIEVHRAPVHWAYYTTRVTTYPYGAYDKRSKTQWCRADLVKVNLSAPAGAAVEPNTGRAKGNGLRVWNHTILRKLWPASSGDPCEELRPIKLRGARNGTFAGQIVAESGAAIRGIKVEVSDLKGPGVIPKSAVAIRYALPDGFRHRGRIYRMPKERWYESLDEVAPAEVPVGQGAALQPIWLTVKIPKDAKAGDYQGSVTVSATGHKPIEAQLQVRVADWTLPDTRDFTTRMDFVQSPTSVALAYDVPMWSEKHWKLLERSLSVLGPMADKTLYITAVRRTHFGNEHAMVRWKKDAKGKLQPDISVVEKYLDLAIKHQGKIPGVILYCWEPPDSMGHAGTGPKRIHDRPILITIVGPGGKLEKAQGPKWGTPECRQLWQRLSTAVKAMLKKRGMEKSLMFGLIGDHRPTKRAMDEINTGAPEVKWAVHSHHYCDKWQGHEVGMCIALWGVRCYPRDPDVGRGYGWKNDFWLSLYPRNQMSIASPLVDHRTQAENQLGAVPASLSRWSKAKGLHGIGRIGADFWPAVKDKRGRRSTIAGRYPESAWGQLNLNYCVPSVLGIGKKGPVPTVRSEAFRESVQECEARIFIEKAMDDAGKKAKLGEDLVKRCGVTLDERRRMCLYSVGKGWMWYVSSGWAERDEKLFNLAAEVSKKLGVKGPGK